MNKETHASDEVLLKSIKSGSEAAFTELYNRYWKLLLIKALDRLQSQDDAEEVVQDIFINLWNRRNTIELKYTFRTYISSVLKYEVWSRIAQQTRQNTLMALEEIGDHTAFISSQNSLDSRLETQELQRQLDEIIDTLPDQCRLIFRLSRNEEMSAKEIAESLQISPRTVETQISKALKVIRGSLHKLFLLLTLLLPPSLLH